MATERQKRIKKIMKRMADERVGNRIIAAAASILEPDSHGVLDFADGDPNEYMERACKMLKKIPHSKWDDRLPEPPKCKLTRRMMQSSYDDWRWEDELPYGFSKKRYEY